jgi:methylmalonyl-CoA mutase cobalamin-binding subunit
MQRTNTNGKQRRSWLLAAIGFTHAHDIGNIILALALNRCGFHTAIVKRLSD